MFTSSWRALKLDSVLFVERSGELLYVAWLSTKKVRSRRETESKKGEIVRCNRPETG
jgi:sensor domain CHASE-containing protein